MLAQFVHAEGLLARRAGRPEHRVDECAQPVRLVDDDGGVFLQARLVQFALEQLSRAAQPTERIPDLVRQLPHHQPVPVDARQQLGLAVDALAGARVDQLEQQVRASNLAAQRCSNHIHHDGRGRGRERGDRCQREFMPGADLAAAKRAPQQFDQGLRAGKQFADRVSARLAQAQPQQVLRAHVGVHHAQLRVEHQQARGQGVEHFPGVEVPERRGAGHFSGHGRPASVLSVGVLWRQRRGLAHVETDRGRLAQIVAVGIANGGGHGMRAAVDRA